MEKQITRMMIGCCRKAEEIKLKEENTKWQQER